MYCFFICRSGKESDSEAEDLEHAEKLRHVKAVLEEVWISDIQSVQSDCEIYVGRESILL